MYHYFSGYWNNKQTSRYNNCSIWTKKSSFLQFIRVQPSVFLVCPITSHKYCQKLNFDWLFFNKCDEWWWILRSNLINRYSNDSWRLALIWFISLCRIETHAVWSAYLTKLIPAKVSVSHMENVKKYVQIACYTNFQCIRKRFIAFSHT